MNNENLEIQRFNITDMVIQNFRKDFLCLKILGMDDKEGYAKVKEARITVKTKRVEVEKVRKELKEESLAYGRKVDGEAKRITALLTPIEDYLESEQKKIDDEKERIKQAEMRKLQEQYDERNKALAQLGVTIDYSVLLSMPNDEYLRQLSSAKLSFENEKKRLANIESAKAEELSRIAKIADDQEAERQRLAAAKVEQDAREEKLKAAEAAIEAEKKAAADKVLRESAEKNRLADLEAAREQAAELARVETEARINREAEKKAELERMAKIEADELAALRPDKEKLEVFAYAIEAMTIQNLSSDEATAYFETVKTKIFALSAEIKSTASKLRKSRKSA